jgi:ribose transport system substrate-binding protein
MKMLGGRLRRYRAMALAAGATVAVLVAPLNGAAAREKYTIYLSMSYIGNDWQAEAQRMIEAMAASKKYRDKIDLKIQVAGPDARKQIQQINAMVQAGAQAIITFPISPTALNNAVKGACEKHIFVIAYDAEISEPCAYNIHIDQREAGRIPAEWLAHELNGRGNIVLITGVPGTSVDKLRTAGGKEVFAQYPEIKIIAEVPGMWSQATTREKLSQILATRRWNDIDGLWTQGGCYTIAAMQIEAGIPTDKIRPCAGESENGTRVMMLPPGAVAGVDAIYKPFGYRSISYGSPPYSGALALKKAVELLEGNEVSKTITLPLPLARPGEMKLCETGSWEEMKQGCNVFDPKLVPPGWLADIYGPDTPEVGFRAALLGQPEE